ncbi:MAG: hypothetical protein KJ970_12540 [Candidatus Eisenbacteria bacterium]|uniref:DUF6868 domain-containing protein n=1 Tax=Eiseniibacteriota bacterium TaxID=2212470 RepID=A0A948RWF6_UNCEI|nr:hypothetical protein [Candidatus Eisenbacteria bacterium]MBU1950632.1 hypothetical protein [Candidatus Eisenbacteria bacterium]MBU2691746.1 hypothetical protein [Candidatus Eisenbacteria bacterium]
MTLEVVRSFFAWCSVINMALLVFWFLLFTFTRDWLKRFHGKWFNLSDSSFNAIHYGGLMFLKISLFLFNLVPYFALRIIG